MQKLVWKNADGTELNLTSGSYGITNWEGFSNTELNIQSQQVPFSDGSVFLDALLNQRELSITLAINDENDLYRRYELKRQLISALNPKMGEGYLIYTNDFISKRIKCIARLPIFPNKNSNDAGTQKASLSWVACKPYWEDLEETETTVIFGEHKEINNNGDVPFLAKIEFLTNGVKNPSIGNLTTGKKISLQNEFDNSVYIDTKIGRKKIYKEDINFSSQSVFFSQALCSNDRVCCVIGSSSIFVTKDGINYEERLKPINKEIKKCIFSAKNNKFVAVGLDGTIITGDAEGNSWELQSSGTSVNLMDIIESDTLDSLIAVGYDGTILKSLDAQNWQAVNSGFSDDFLCVVVFDGKLVVGSLDGIIVSADSINWERNSNIITRSLFCIDGMLFSSPNSRNYSGYGARLEKTSDLLTWEKTNFGAYIDVFYNKKFNLYFYISVYNVSYSFQLFEHEKRIFTENNTTKYLVYFAKNNNFVCVNSHNSKWYSWNGIDYILSENNVPDVIFLERPTSWIDFTAIKWNGEIYVAVGTWDAILYSFDGMNFKKGWMGSSISSYFNNVDYSTKRKKWMIYQYDTHRIFSSSDGMNWKLDGFIYIEVKSTVYCEEVDRFFALTGGSVYRSDSSYHFSTYGGVRVDAGKRIRAIKGRLYVVGSNNNYGAIYRSNENYDYQTWNNFQSSVTQTVPQINDIAYGESPDTFVAVGNNGTIIFRKGDSWDYAVSFTDEHLNSIVYSDEYGLFIVAGSNGVKGYSVDGKVWKSFPKTSSKNITSIIYNKKYNKFTAVGEADFITNTEIQKSGNLIQELSSDSNMNFEFKQGKNIVFLDKVSGNLICRLTYRQKYIGV